jgi:uncharacterized protein YjbI with pentapeptide repeats
MSPDRLQKASARRRATAPESRPAAARPESLVTRVSLTVQAIAAVVAAGAVIVTLPPALGALEGVRVSKEQVDITREGQLTDRFTAAVDQLGSDKKEVQLGGIYALERLARDSQPDQPVIIEVLCAFVRLHSPASAPSAPPRAVPTEVVAAATVVVRRQARTDPDQIDFASVNLAGLDLSTATRPPVVPDLFRARLQASRLDDMNLGRANMRGADLTGAQLRRTKLRGNLIGANLTAADFTDAVLEATLFDKAFAKDAKLVRARLNGAYLRRTSLTDSDLSGAVLDGAHLEGVLAPGADFAGARLQGTYLMRADLSTTRNLTLAQLRSARVDQTTALPPGFRWNAQRKIVEKTP